MKRALALCLLVCTTVAHAAPHTVLVLRAEGSADAATRTSVDSHVLRLAKHIDAKVDAGDITLTDAAAAAGCNAADASCKDEILMTFAVDEMVTTTATATPGGVTVTVRRLTKGTAPKAAQTTFATGAAPEASLDADIGPLFGLAAKQPAPDPQPQPQPTPEPTTPPATAQPPVDTVAQMHPEPAPMLTTPEGVRPDRRLQKIGMAAGAGLVLLGIVMWGAASSKQSEIDDAPVNTPADFVRLRELEQDADGLAGGGNLFFLGGVALGGISAYYYWKKGRLARAQTARITPTVFPHGAGVVLTFGGAR